MNALRTQQVDLRQSAVILSSTDAARLVAELGRLDVSVGGVWNASSTIWQRYDRPWDGKAGCRGNALLVGSIGVMYDAPIRYQITLYRVTVTGEGVALGWTPQLLVGDAVGRIGHSLESVSRTDLGRAPGGDPFHRRHVSASQPT